jgi:serine O-acetyltransferase
MKVLFLYRIGHRLHTAGFKRFARFTSIINRLVFSAEIPASCYIGQDVKLKHGGLGVVLHDRVRIGDRCVIFHNVTIGGRNGMGCPTIGDDAFIGCGAVLLGPIKIGNGAKIGANATVLHDVESNATITGPVAHVIQST